jgi:hypothetical protein
VRDGLYFLGYVTLLSYLQILDSLTEEQCFLMLHFEGVREDAAVNAIIAILTLVTAVGAIWAAIAATRQAQASSRQARVAEQGLGEQIRSFREQTELAREQNERARLNLEADLMYKLGGAMGQSLLPRLQRKKPPIR